MSLSATDFWKLTVQSRLLTKTDCQLLHSRFNQDGTTKTDDAKKVAAWLITEKRITEYQAKNLLSGHAGPFHFGDYLVRNVLPGGDTTKRLKGLHLPTNHKVILHFHAYPESISDAAWSAACSLAQLHAGVLHANLDLCYQTVTRSKHKIAVTEDVKGENAADHINRNGRLPITAACQIVRQAAQGIQALQRANLVHGRVEPKNLCIQSNGNVRLLRHPTIIPESVDLTLEDPKGRLSERSDYFAPELAGPTKPNSATDMYALGCCFYEMLAGHPPFSGGSVDAKMIRHAQESVRSLEELVGAPKEVADIVIFMLAKNYNLRFKPEEVIKRLEPFCETQNKIMPIVRSTQSAYLKHIGSEKPPQVRNPQDAKQDSSPEDPKPPPQADESAQLITTRSGAVRRRKSSSWQQWALIGIGIVAGIVVVAIVLASLLNNHDTSTDPRRPTEIKQAPETAPVETESRRPASSNQPTDQVSNIVVDDGITLWVSPTTGGELNVDYLPSGAQLLGLVRLSEIVNSAEGRRVIRALGPRFDSFFRSWHDELKLAPHQIEVLAVGLRPADIGPPEPSFVLTLNEPKLAENLIRNLQPVETALGLYVLGDEKSYFQPVDKNILIISSRSHVQGLVDGQSPKPLLNHAFTNLLKSGDDKRHFTVVTNPNFMVVGGRSLFRDNRATIQNNILQLVGDDTQAMSFSLHMGENFYGELRIERKSDGNTFSEAAKFNDRLKDLPNQLIAFLGSANVGRHWQALAIRFPIMVQFLIQHTRTVPGRNQTVSNFVLPPKAAHNLVLAAEFSIAAVNVRMPSQPTVAISVQDVLRHPTSYQFAQQSLEFAIRDIQTSINEKLPGCNFSIKIVGSDLELEGITRNQQIKDFVAQNISVSDLLTQFVMRANSVPNVESAADPNQKLVWVVDPVQPESGTSILITTRQATNEKGYKLPDPFLPIRP